MDQANTQFKPTLGLMDATMIVAGSMIGSGIFIVSADITRNVGSAGWLVAVWLLTGFMTLTAALSYGELSAMFPKAGGQYVYLKESYNPLLGFLYGGQNYPENFHFCTFDFLTLESVLKEIGFSHVKTYDWRKTEHSFIDDYSQAYIPHMDKENGMLMSLNIEAIK
jgi:amino acid transporter